MSKRSKRDERNLDIAKRLAKNLIAHRIWSRLTQTQMGDIIGVSFQQYQKMEKCVNRIYAEDLQRICENRKWDITMMYADSDAMLDEWMQRDYPNNRAIPREYEQVKEMWKKSEISADKYYKRRTEKLYNVMTNREE